MAGSDTQAPQGGWRRLVRGVADFLTALETSGADLQDLHIAALHRRVAALEDRLGPAGDDLPAAAR